MTKDITPPPSESDEQPLLAGSLPLDPPRTPPLFTKSLPVPSCKHHFSKYLLPTTLLEEVYNSHTGFGLAQILCYCLVGMIPLSGTFQLTVISVLIPVLRCDWSLNPHFEAAITVSVFGSCALTALLLSKLSDQYGRRRVVMVATVVMMLGVVLGVTAPNKWVFLAGRVVVGACVGVNSSIVICYATEYASSRWRTIGVTVLISAMFLSVFLVNLLAWFALNNIGWRWFLVLVSTPLIPLLILVSFLPESPRYLVVSGQSDRALAALSWLAKMNSRSLPPNLAVVCYGNAELGRFRELFSPRYRRATIALAISYASNIFLEFGLVLLLPLLFNTGLCGGGAGRVPTHSCSPLSSDDLQKLTISAGASLVGTGLAVVSAQSVGRLLPLRLSNLVKIIVMGCFFICVNENFTLALTCLIRLAEAYVNVLLMVMIPESFPTTIRSTGGGFVNGCGKMGGVLGTGCVYLMFYSSPHYLLGLFVGSCALGMVGALLYERETRDIVLTDV
eukprot:sb/3464035/